jgi:hypothetical protein
MKPIWVLLAAGCLIAFGADAQNTSNAQTSASANAEASTSASVGRTAAQAESNASAAGAVNAGSNRSSNAIQLQDGQTIHANLEHSVDAKKCKPGDPVEARTTEDVKQNGQVVLKKGSRLHGHVTEAQARSKGSAESSLGVAFDSVTTKHGEQLPMHLGIQAIASPASATAASVNSDGGEMLGAGGMAGGSARASGGGLLGGSRGAVGGATGITGGATGSLAGSASGGTTLAGGAAGNVAGSAGGAVNGTVNGAAGATARGTGGAIANVGGLNAAGQLTSGSRGVFGLQGLTLNSAANSATQASVVTSTSRNVHLDSGTQMELQAIAQ